MTHSHIIDTPVGPIILRSDGTHLVAASFADSAASADPAPNVAPAHLASPATRPGPSTPAAPTDAPDVIQAAAAQLSEYFGGTRIRFDIPLAPAGTEFQLRVWEELQRIPFGTRISYGELARRMDAPDAVRAVGAANGRNPIAVFIPCHRVVGADGSLTGYAGGIERKRRLLEMESGELKLFD